ncbi:MAG TPA: ROK family protein [Egibacteraceae bacterium]|nr:ROK family protein [Egibacteraceae bacterium]
MRGAPAPAAAVGVDVGGTKTVGGVVGADGTVRVRARVPTPPQGGDAVTDAIAALVADLWRQAGGAPLPVGVGAAGVFDRSGVLRYSPNIPGWDEVPLAARLSEALGVAVRADNDANVAAWGECRAGAARDIEGTVVMLTVGTGIGGGLVQDGALVRGAHGMAAEFGHIVVAEGGPLCGCGNRGCLEALASGTAIGRTAAQRLAAGHGSALAGEGSAPTGKSVTLAAQAGDELATAVLAECGFWLGVGIASLVNALDPDLVVVGGGAMQAGEMLLGPAREAAAARVIGGAHRQPTPVVAAALGDDAGLVGAALLALEAG